MIRSFECPRATDFFNNILSKEILDLKPIIAGGSAVAAYRASLFYDTEYKWEHFLKKGGPQAIKSEDIIFGDVDIWFSREQAISHPYQILLKDYSEGKYFELAGKRIKTLEEQNKELSEAFTKVGKVEEKNDLKNIFSFDFNTKNSADRATTDDLKITTRELNQISNLGFHFAYVSRWSNTFMYAPEMADKNQDIYFNEKNPAKAIKIQFIRNSVDSIEELLEQFDFINCCIAYYDGKLYIKDGVDQAFESFKAVLNNKDIVSDAIPLPQRILCAIRAFKYCKRYMLTFDQNVADFAFRVFVESFEHHKEQPETEKIKLTGHLSVIPASPPMPYNDYENKTLAQLKGRLYNEFNNFQKMNTFKKEFLPYFLNCNVPGIESRVKQRIDPEIKPEIKTNKYILW